MKDALERIARRGVPDDIDLWPRIEARLQKRNSLIYALRARPALIILMVVLILLSLTGVAYAVGNMLGFIPGVGIIERGAPLRVLDRPVTQTRNGVTVTVEQVVLSTDKTVVLYKIEGIPVDAYSASEGVLGCNKTPELLLPDGTSLLFSSGGGGWGTGYESKAVFSAIPANVNQATFDLPCISGTLPDVLPGSWALQLRFIPAPANLTVMPIIEISPSPASSEGAPNSSSRPLSLDKIIETQDGYILIGKFNSTALPASSMTLGSISRIRITDANGNEVFTTVPNDVDAISNQTGEATWAYEIKGRQQAWPLTITVDFVNAGLPSVDEVKLDFNTGPNPQINQNWILNKDLVSNGYHITLSSIQRLTDGYKFKLKADPRVTGVGVWIKGFSASGGGGGGDGKGNFNQSNVFEGAVPSGKLTLVVAVQSVRISGPWSITWQPSVSPVPAPATASATPNIACLTSTTLQKLAPIPTGLSGKVLSYESLDGINWGVYLTNINGGQNQTVALRGNWAAFSPDGKEVVYSGADSNLHIVDLATDKDGILAGATGYDPHISPDGELVANVDNRNLNIIGLDGSNPRHIPINSITFALAGWSPDGEKLYIATPDARGFTLQAVDVATGKLQDLFVLEDSSHKAPYATVSPDGAWVAYRDSGNSSIYLMRIDGSERRLVVDRPAEAISSIVWSTDGKWLGVSLAQSNTDERTVVIFQPENCEAFISADVHGEIQGLVVP